MKKIISLLLTFCLLSTMVCLEIPSSADTSEYTYEIDGNGNAALLRFNNRDNCGSEITVPSEIDGHPVTVIANGCFFGLYELEKLNLPQSVVSIEGSALAYTKLKSVTGCENVVNVTEECFKNTPLLSAAKKQGEFYFGKCLVATYAENLGEEYTVKDGTEKIEYRAFACNDTLKKVTLPVSLKYIDDSAFYSMEALSDITLPDGVESIGYTAFSGCSSLEKINIPSSVRFIGAAAFFECYNLNTITFAEGITEISPESFEKCGVKDLTIPSSVKRIGHNAFFGCEQLEKLTVLGEVEFIGYGAFNCCKQLKEVSFSNGVKELEGGTFASCSSLMDTDMVKNVEKMGYGVFSYCSFGPYFVIKNYMKNIPERTFGGCENLRYVVIEDGVESIDIHAFADSRNLEYVVIPASVTDIDPEAFADTSDFFIIGEKGSRAESFAKENRRDFLDVNDIKGDVNCNYLIDVSDALYTLQAYVGSRVLDKRAFNAADIDNDGEITVLDALYILQYAVGLRQTLYL